MPIAERVLSKSIQESRPIRAGFQAAIQAQTNLLLHQIADGEYPDSRSRICWCVIQQKFHSDYPEFFYDFKTNARAAADNKYIFSIHDKYKFLCLKILIRLLILLN